MDPKDQKKNAPPAAPTPPNAPAAPPAAPAAAAPALSTADELEKAKAELKGLEDAQQLAQVKARIENLKHGGASPAEVQRKKASAAKRDATVTFEEDGKRFAKYQAKDEQYRSGSLVKKGAIINLPYDLLPGDSLLAVEPVKPTDNEKFAAKG